MEACSRDGVDVRSREVIRILGGAAAWPAPDPYPTLASKVDRIVALKTVSMILQRADEIIE